jgi:hypothetical protein
MGLRSEQASDSILLRLVPRESVDGRPHVVIVGAGFGGLTAAKGLAKAAVEVTLIDRENHHLFQPLLYQVATAGLSPAEIAWPIRGLVRRQRNTRVLLGEVTGVERGRHVVTMGDQEVPYDFLVLATGATHAYFGKDGWAEHAPGLKSIDDATEIRRRLAHRVRAGRDGERSPRARRAPHDCHRRGRPDWRGDGRRCCGTGPQGARGRLPDHRSQAHAGAADRGRAKVAPDLPRRPIPLCRACTPELGRRSVAWACDHRL